MRISLAFGKRDEKKYSDVIQWLESIEPGWRNDEIKEALSYYVKMKNSNLPQQNSLVNNITSVNTQPVINQTVTVTEEKMEQLNNIVVQDDDYMEIKVEKTSTNNEENIDSSGIDNFLGDF